MNLNNVISLPVAADLSTYSYVPLTLTSTGVLLAGVNDFAIGTLLQGNVYPAIGQSAVGLACDIQLRGGATVAYVTLGANSVAINRGDELEQAANGTVLNKRTCAAITGAITAVFSTGVFTSATAHGFAIGDAVRIVSQTGGAGPGLTPGKIYFVQTVPSTTTFTLTAVTGDVILGTAADLTYWTSGNLSACVLQRVGNGIGQTIIAIDSAPVTSTGGQINALLL